MKLKERAKLENSGKLETCVVPPEFEGDLPSFFGPMFQVHGSAGRPYGMLRTNIKIAIGQGSWFHVSTAPKAPGRHGFGRLELTDSFHGGSISGALETATKLANGLGCNVEGHSVTRADLSVNRPGGYVPELASLGFECIRGWLAKSTHKRVIGDPAQTIYVGDKDETGYEFCIYHKKAQIVKLWRDKRITEYECQQRLARLDVLGQCSEVTRTELRLKGEHLRAKGCGTIDALGPSGESLFTLYATENLEWMSAKVDRSHSSRAQVLGWWEEMRDSARYVPWDLSDDRQSVVKQRKERLAMTLEQRQDRKILQQLDDVALLPGLEFETTMDMRQAIHRMIDTAFDRLESCKSAEEIYQRLKSARLRYATEDKLPQLDLPVGSPILDEVGRVVGESRREVWHNRVPRSVVNEARERVADLFSGLPF